MALAVPDRSEDDEVRSFDLGALRRRDRVDRAADQAMPDQAASEFEPDIAFGQVHAGGAGGEGDVAPRADQHGNW